jgi:hypothetical protein
MPRNFDQLQKPQRSSMSSSVRPFATALSDPLDLPLQMIAELVGRGEKLSARCRYHFGCGTIALHCLSRNLCSFGV